MGETTGPSPQLILKRGTRQAVGSAGASEVLTWQAYQQRLAERGKRAELRRYRGVELLVGSLEHIHRPLATSLLLRAIARGRCVVRDDSGRTRRITAGRCLGEACRAARDRLATRALLRRSTEELDRIEQRFAERGAVRLDLARRPVYLRTDLTFGLTSGGSVGHVAGVLNTLHHFTAPPLWLTTDTLPIVDPDIEHVLLDPGQQHWGHHERIALAANLGYASQVDSALNGIDAASIYQRYSLNNYTGLRLAADFGVPFVIEFNGSEPWIARHWADGPLRYEPIAQRIETMNLKHADLVVVVSEAMREQAVGLGARPDRVLVNPNGVDTGRYHPDVGGSAVRDALGLHGKTVVGFIGTFDRWHGAPVLVDAIGRLLTERPALRESVACVMIGDGPEFEMVRLRVAELRLGDVVHLTGRVSQEQGPAYLAACDILASPHVRNPDGSAFFGSPTKLFEYLAMGRVVVASRLGQIGEVLEDGQTALLVEPGDAGELAGALERLVAEPDLRDRLARAGRDQAEREHTWHRHTQRIVDRLASVLNG